MAPRPMTQSLKILIVEDEPLIAMMLEDFLDAIDHQVAGSVDCVDDAPSRIGEGGFDLAILDVNLRGDASITASRSASPSARWHRFWPQASRRSASPSWDRATDRLA